MSRSHLVPILAAALVLSLPHGARAARCPFNGHAQITIWVQMQQQVRAQQQMVAHQQQHAARANCMGPQRANVPVPRQTSGRNNRSGITSRRSTSTRATTTIHRSQSTQLIRNSSAQRMIWWDRLRPDDPVPPGREYVTWHIATRRTESATRITRTVLHPTTVVRRTSEEQRGLFRQPQDWVRHSNACRQIEKPARQAPAQRNDARATRKTVQSVHPALVWVRITMNVRCGGCHRCQGHPSQKGGQLPGVPTQIARKPRLPFQQGKPPGMPFQVGKKPERDMPIARPGMPFQEGPGKKPIDRLVRMPNPRQPFMIRPNRPALQPIVRVDQPPALPPLAGIVRLPAGRPTPGWMVPSKIETTPQPSTSEQPAPSPSASTLPPATQPATTLDPPALPPLEGSIVQLNPILGAKQAVSSESEDSSRELLPSDVAAAPALPPLPGKLATDRGLLPTLDRDERSDPDAFDPSARPSALDLVLQPPALPEVVSR